MWKIVITQNLNTYLPFYLSHIPIEAAIFIAKKYEKTNLAAI